MTRFVANVRYRGRMTDHDRPTTTDGITASRFRATEGVGEQWPVIDGATTFFATDSFATSTRLLEAIAGIDGIEEHRPDIDIRPDGVTIRLVTRADDWWGMTERDVRIASGILAAAASLDLRSDPSVVQAVDPIVIGAVDIDRIRPFWAALMGYIARPDSPKEDLVDPRRRNPGIWFETMDEVPLGRNRMHVAVWLPYEQAESRVAAAVATGGTVIFDRAPAWWTLADPEGNEADIATIVGRD